MSKDAVRKDRDISSEFYQSRTKAKTILEKVDKSVDAVKGLVKACKEIDGSLK